MMDIDVLLSKLESLARCVSRIRGRTPASADLLMDDIDAQDIIALNLERAIQVSVDIGSHILAERETASPETMADVFRTLGKSGLLDSTLAQRLAAATGFRNIAVHQYRALDWNVVYSIITDRLEDFSMFAAAVEALIKAAECGSSAGNETRN